MNKHNFVKFFKKMFFGKYERYSFNGTKLLFLTGSRPIYRKYENHESSVVRNDVLQINLFEKEFKHTDILWDIGSHHGHYSIFAASIVKDEKQVYSFEPDKEAREIQQCNIAANNFQNKITTSSFVISENDGYIKFNSMGGNANSHIVKTGEIGDGIITIEARSINSLLTQFPKPTWVKIDVEGAEIDVLRGADKLLNDKSVRFVCELHPFAWEAFSVSYDEFKNIITDAKRTIQVLDNRNSLNDLPYYGTVLF